MTAPFLTAPPPNAQEGKKEKMTTKKIDIAKQMPNLHHKNHGQEYDVKNSEVVDWLVAQPEIRQRVFNEARSNLIYDAETGEWRGVDYAN